MFAEVVLSKTSSFLDKTYHYGIPDNLKVEVGQEVLVPFGKRKANGYVIGIIEKAEVEKTKDILEIISTSPLFDEKTVKLARWISEYYLSFFMRALNLFLPSGGKDTKYRGQETRNKIQDTNKIQYANIKLTKEQELAVREIKQAIDNNRPEIFLLYGVTGSGKTEVYMQAVAQVLEKGKSAMVLEPEIGMTPQLTERFRERFQNHIAVMHSGLTDKERRAAWEKVASGVGRIVLGTRMALFSPVRNLGLIVLDEEYEKTYKSDMSPRYHAREVAFQFGVPVILGSATPSLETYYKAEAGEYKKLVLPERIDRRPLPPVEVIDMREEVEQKNFGVLSGRLKEELQQVLSSGEQAILFINRLGYFTFIMCRECGLTIECPKCTGSLTYHSTDRKLHCSRCGYFSEAPIICPRCQSSSIKYFGAGTQRIEKEVADIFPAVRILRVDRDTVSKKGSHDVIFKTFGEKKADVLIGTQMVTKGLDLASVTLVGVVAADTALSLPDFRAAEHTFQLLTQVAGRAGRHHLPGKVIIQTYNPEHYAIKAAANHDYEGFFQKEIEHRRELNYPPFSKLIGLLLTGPEVKKVEKTAEDLEKFLKKRISQGVLGPAPAAIPKQRGLFRFHLLLKGQDLDILRKAVKESLDKIVIPSEIKVSIDVEPVGMG